MKRWLPTSMACFLVLFCVSPALAQVNLRYKFKAGDKLDYVVEQKMKMDQNIGGMDIQISMNQQMEMTWNVQSVNDKGAAKIKIHFGRMKMSMETPMGKVEVDSAKKEEPDDQIGKMVHQAITAIAGMEMTVTMDSRGEMSDVSTPEKTLEKLKALPGMGEMFSPDSLKQMVTSGLVLPKDAVAKGAKWNHENSMKMPFGKMLVDMQYTYEGEVQRDGMSLQKIAFKPSAKLEPDPNAPVSIKMKSTKGGGTMLFDNSAGRIVEINGNQVMNMDVAAGGVNVSQTINADTVLKLKKSTR